MLASMKEDKHWETVEYTSFGAGAPYMTNGQLQRLTTNRTAYASALPFLLYVKRGEKLRVTFDGSVSSVTFKIWCVALDDRPENITVAGGAKITAPNAAYSTPDWLSKGTYEFEATDWSHVVVYFRKSTGDMTSTNYTNLKKAVTIEVTR